MDAREYLSQYLSLERDIKRWERIKARLLALDSEEYLDGVMRITANYGGIPGKSSGQDKIGAAVARKCDLDSGRDIAELNAKIDAAKTKMLEVAESIDAVPYSDEREALDMKYLQGLFIQEAADKMKCSCKTVRRLIQQGVEWIVCPDLSTKVHD